MAVFMCEKCGSESVLLEKCMGCGKKICRNCMKSQKKLHKLDRICICKGCWEDIKKRSVFKSAR